jgi:hypothetical protein
MKVAIACVMTAVLAVGVHEAQAQEVMDSLIVHGLRSAVGAPANADLALVRDSAPGLFPGVVAVRTTWDSRGAQTAPTTAAAFVVNGRAQVVSGLEDLSRLPALGSPFDVSSRFATVEAWRMLLELAGIIGRDEMVVSSASEIPDSVSARLTPKKALRGVRRPKIVVGRERVSATFVTVGGNGLIRFCGIYQSPGALRVTAESLARAVLTGL